LIAIFHASLILPGCTRATAHRAIAAIVHGWTLLARAAEISPNITVEFAPSSPRRRTERRAARLWARPVTHRADIRAWAESLTIAGLWPAGCAEVKGPVAVRANLWAGTELARASLWAIPCRTPLRAETLPRRKGALRPVEGPAFSPHLRSREPIGLFLSSLVAPQHLLLLCLAVLLADFFAVLAGGRGLELAGLISLGLAEDAQRREAEGQRQ
jgi:hypothetical protein